MEKSKKKIVYLEKLRVFALFLVLYTHSNKAGVTYFENASTDAGYWLSLFLVPISQCCVNLFFMISGVVLLHKQEKIKELYLHRVVPFAVTTAAVVLVQYIQNSVTFGFRFSFLDYLKALYSGGSVTEHWFLYAYLSFLMILPFLRAVATGLDGKSAFWYLAVIKLAVDTVCPMWEAVSDWEGLGLNIPLLTTIVFYPLMGHFMECAPESFFESKRRSLLVNIVTFTVALGNCLMNHHSLIYGGKTAYTVTFAALFTCVIFWDFRMFGNRDAHAKFWFFAGSGVFGTYLFEPQLRFITEPLKGWILGSKTPYLLNFVLLLLMEIVGILLVDLFKKIPHVDKFI